MAAKESNVATGSVESNMYHVSGYPYKSMIPSLNKGDIITVEQYKHSELYEYFEIDRTSLYRNGKCNPNHVFELYGCLSGHTSAQVRVMTLQAIAANVQFYKDRSSVCLGMRGNYFEGWLSDIADTNHPCDELGLLTLSYLYKRHCLVYTSSKIWSTIESSGPMSLLELFNECTVRLIYLGDLEFGVLKPRKKTSTPVSSTQPISTCVNNLSTLPVESTTIDIPVETSVNEAISAPPDTPLHVETKTEPNCVKEELELESTPSTPADDLDLSDEQVYSVLEPSSYFFVKNVQIKLHRLGDEEIKKWTKPQNNTCDANKGYRLRVRQSRASRTGISLRNNKVVNYRPMLKVSKKDIETNTTGRKRQSARPKQSGPSSTRIRANQLVLKAKQFTTKPVTKKYPVATESGSTVNELPLPDTSPVETNPTANDAAHVETYDSSTDDYEPPEKPVATGNAPPANVATDSAKPKR